MVGWSKRQRGRTPAIEGESEKDGPSVEGEEFLGMMEERGLIVPRPPTLGERFYRALGAPFRAIGRLGHSIYWAVWGKRRNERLIQKQIKRMKLLAGVDDPKSRFSPTVEKVGYINKGGADAVRLDLSRRIVREELPKPDFDDTGVN